MTHSPDFQGPHGAPAHTLLRSPETEELIHSRGHSFVASLRSCTRPEDVTRGIKLHVEIARTGLLMRNIFVGGSLIGMYIKCGSFSFAQEAFQELHFQNVVTCTVLIGGHVEEGHGAEALKTYERMQLEGIIPNAFTLVSILKACSILKALDTGQCTHAKIQGQELLEKDLVVGNALLHMYMKCGSLTKAHGLFGNLKARNVVTWSTLMEGHVEHGLFKEALKLFDQMQLRDCRPDSATFICYLKACGSIGDMHRGQNIHVEVERRGLLRRNPKLESSLVSMYAKCGSHMLSQEVVYGSPVRNIILLNALISGYVDNEWYEEALKSYHTMQVEGVSADACTFIAILKTCGNLKAVDKGYEIHTQIEQRGLLEGNIVIGNALIHMYAECGSLNMARHVFDGLYIRDVVSWNVLMTGYIEHGHAEQALQLFEHLQIQDVSPNVATLLCTLKACGRLGDIDIAYKIHAEIERQGLVESTIEVGNAIVDLYGKFGLLVKAQEVFDKLPSHNIVTWNSLIAGYAENEHNEEALMSFEQMPLEEGVPDAVTFIYALRSCGSIGAVDKGRKIHAETERRGLLEADPVVGNALVVMYAMCGGTFDVAQEVFGRLPIRDIDSWNSLISGYAERGLGEHVVECFKQMQDEHVLPNAATVTSVLKSCGCAGATDTGRQLHLHIEREGLMEMDHHIGNSLINMYAKLGLLATAEVMFSRLQCRDVFSWTALIAGYAELGCTDDVLKSFNRMRKEGVLPNPVTFSCCLKACSSIAAGFLDLHSEIERQGCLQRDPIVGPLLVNAYAHCGSIVKAQVVSDRLPIRNVASWNALIIGYHEDGQSEKAIWCFKQMHCEGVSPNATTNASIIKACSRIEERDKSQHLLRELEHNFLSHEKVDLIVGTTLVHSSFRIGLLDKTWQWFDRIVVKDAFLWTVLIVGYVESGYNEVALECFDCMRWAGFNPNTVTYASSLKACGGITAREKVLFIHAEVEKLGLLQGDLVLGNTLVSTYAKSGLPDHAQSIFDCLPHRNVASWTAMMAGYALLGESRNVFSLFDNMRGDEIKPDHITFIVLLNMCSRAGLLSKSKHYFEVMEKDYGIVPHPRHHAHVVRLYGCTGQLNEVVCRIQETPLKSNTAAWPSMLNACKNWGHMALGEHMFAQAVSHDIEGGSQIIR